MEKEEDINGVRRHWLAERGFHFQINDVSVGEDMFWQRRLLWEEISLWSREKRKIEIQIERESISSGPPRLSSRHKGDLFVPEEQRAGNERQIQRIEEEEGKGERNRGEAAMGIFPWGTKDCLCLERRQAWLTGKWKFIKGKENNSCLDEVFNFVRKSSWGGPKGPFDS